MRTLSGTVSVTSAGIGFVLLATSFESSATGSVVEVVSSIQLHLFGHHERVSATT
jgi:hypothetical protein